jgi:thiamine biosynthesis protein ThiI
MFTLDTVLIRYGEVTLKARWTRKSWERLLTSNISLALRQSGVGYALSRDGGRIFVQTDDEEAARKAAFLIAQVFGVVSTSPVYTVEPDILKVSDLASELAASLGPTSFAIRSRRSGGDISSTRLAVDVGSAVKERTGASVDLEDPLLEIFIEARRDRILVFTEVIKGVGGLPLGSQARMLALVSGGIDSPVAAWMMMRRGCPVSLLHFDARPYMLSSSQAERSAEILKRWSTGRKIPLVRVPIGRGIEAISSSYPRETCILCRRLMYRVAGLLMEEERAAGVVTGYSLGQVASQTPENIRAEEAGIDIPVYHPLIAMDKSEIMDAARRIGTLQVTEEAGSCTAAPRKPITKAKLWEILEADLELGLSGMARELFEKRERIVV